MRFFYSSILTLAICSFSFGQIRFVNSLAFLVANNSSSFLDASSNSNFNKDPNLAKGLLFPRTDLTLFSKFGGQGIGAGSNYPTLYDGMIVYNTAESGVAGVGITDGDKLARGFWYYENKTNTPNGGTWKKLGGSGVGNNIITNEESLTTTTIDGTPVWSFKGEFTSKGDKTKFVLTDLPNATAKDIGVLYKITIYNRDKGVFTNSVYSFDPATKTIVTGVPKISITYPEGEYNYILEYMKK